MSEGLVQPVERVEVAAGSGVVLRALENKDIAWLAELIAENPEHLRFYNPNFRGQIDSIAAAWQEVAATRRKRPYYGFGIHHGDTPVGCVNLQREYGQIFSIGYWIGARFTRRGYASAAIEATAEYAFNTLGARVIEASIRPDNAASIELCKKLGFWDVTRPADEEWVTYRLYNPAIWNS